jgi:hypothetical protein
MNSDSLNIIDILQKVDHSLTYLFGEHVITVIFFILSCIFSYFLYKRSNPSKNLVFFLGTNSIYESSNLGKTQISVVYNGKSVDFLCESILGVMNAGNNIIKKEDLSMKDKLRFNIKDDYKFLDAEVLNQNRHAFQCSITDITEKYIEIDFDFLEYRDIFLIKIIHNCNLKPWQFLEKFHPTGTVMGIRKLEYYGHDPSHDPTSSLLTVSMFGTIIFGTFISYLLFKLSTQMPNFIFIIIYIVTFLILIYFLGRTPQINKIYWKLFKNIPNRDIPHIKKAPN